MLLCKNTIHILNIFSKHEKQYKKLPVFDQKIRQKNNALLTPTFTIKILKSKQNGDM